MVKSVEKIKNKSRDTNYLNKVSVDKEKEHLKLNAANKLRRPKSGRNL